MPAPRFIDVGRGPERLTAVLRRAGISYQLFNQREARGWDVVEAATLAPRSPVAVDRAGQRFGRLVVLERAPQYRSPGGQSHAAWKCRCDCGTERTYLAMHLAAGKARSCGCARRDQAVIQAGDVVGTARELAARAGVRLNTIYSRRKRGLSGDALIATSQMAPITVDGVTRTKGEWLALIGLSREGFRLRLLAGWTVEGALTLPKAQGNWRTRRAG